MLEPDLEQAETKLSGFGFEISTVQRKDQLGVQYRSPREGQNGGDGSRGEKQVGTTHGSGVISSAAEAALAASVAAVVARVVWHACTSRALNAAAVADTVVVALLGTPGSAALGADRASITRGVVRATLGLEACSDGKPSNCEREGG